jgi:predicted RNase H-like HicB family nuclease
MKEFSFVITRAEEGGYNARCREAHIFTQGNTKEELFANMREAVQSHLYPEKPEFVHTDIGITNFWGMK